MDKKKFTLDGPSGAKLHIDESQAFEDDPGNGTPALVEWRGNYGTYWCCSEEGECGGVRLPKSVLNWLDSPKVVEAVEAIRWT